MCFTPSLLLTMSRTLVKPLLTVVSTMSMLVHTITPFVVDEKDFSNKIKLRSANLNMHLNSVPLEEVLSKVL